MSIAQFVHGRSDTGQVRQHNEDAWRVAALPDGSTLLVVCDGMGGHDGGEIASRLAADELVSAVAARVDRPPATVLDEALSAANRAVLEAATHQGPAGMGTTAVVAWLRPEGCWVGWVGDSRLYALRNGRITKRSVDHTRAEQLIAEGCLTRSEARRHPHAHKLVRAIGGSHAAQRNFRPEVWPEPLPIQAGDLVLLSSDGFHDLFSDEELYGLVEGLDYQAAADRLVAEANRRGGRDNITVVVAVAGGPLIPAVATASTAPARQPASGSAVDRAVPAWAVAAVAAFAFALGAAFGASMGQGRGFDALDLAHAPGSAGAALLDPQGPGRAKD